MNQTLDAWNAAEAQRVAALDKLNLPDEAYRELLNAMRLGYLKVDPQ